MTGSDTPFLIVGAGPVGLTAALEFTRRGVPVRIIDRSPGLRTQSRALGIHPPTLDLLEPSGVARRLLDIGNPLTRMRMMSGENEIVSLDLSHIPHRHAFLLVVPQAETERILCERLAEMGVEVEWQTELTGLSVMGDTAQATIMHKGEGETHSYPLIVGADGVRSPVRVFADIGFEGKRAEEEFTIADIRLKDAIDPSELSVRLTQRGVLGAIPISDTLVRYVADGHDLAERLPPVAQNQPIEWDTAFRIAYRIATTFRKGPVFLAGDAGHVHSPVGGRGMNLGIEDACWLAFLHEQDRLDDYSDLRRKAASGVVDMTRNLTEFVTGHALLRNAVLMAANVALRIPPVRRMALERLTGLDNPRAPWLEER